MNHPLLPPSKFLKAFSEATKTCRDAYELVGDCILVEEIQLGDTVKEVARADGTKGRIILSAGEAKRTDGLEMNKPVFCRVLQVGEGWYDPDNKDIVPLEVNVGDVILVGRMSVNWFSVFGTLTSETGKQIGIVRENEIRCRWKGEDGYNAYFSCLNAFTDTKAG